MFALALSIEGVNKVEDISLYIHIPFCQSKCLYCDFCSFSNLFDCVEKYVFNLKREIDIYEEKLKKYKIKTIYIGGGTPSVIDGKFIYEIMDYIFRKLNISNLEEITIEVNPKTLNSNKLEIYKDLGINRISIGVQSMNDEMLKRIGRIHTVKDFINTYNLIRKFNFDNVSFDLMFNLPDQSLFDSIRTLELAAELKPDHISYYSLKVEEGTPFYKEFIDGKLKLPDEDTERQMYHRAIDFLETKGYLHYEISNFARKGYESKHNLVYWRCLPYIGLGLSAHSYFENYRYGNTNNLEHYLKEIAKGRLAIEEKEYISSNMEMAEYMILGLRLINGVNYKAFEDKFKTSLFNIYGDILNKFIVNGLLEKRNDSIALTKKGLDLCNIVFMEILPSTK